MYNIIQFMLSEANLGKLGQLLKFQDFSGKIAEFQEFYDLGQPGNPEKSIPERSTDTEQSINQSLLIV